MRAPRLVIVVVSALVLVGALLLVQPASGAASATASGRITDASGTPLAGVTVAVWDTTRDGSPPYPAYRTTTGADGTYAVAVAPDRYFVCAGGIVGRAFRMDAGTRPGAITAADRRHVGECSGGSWVPADLDAWGTPFTVGAGATAGGQDLALDDPARISGTVRDTDGAPITGIAVLATDGPHVDNHTYDIAHTTTTDTDGRYVIEALAPGDPFCVAFNSPRDPAYSSRIWGGSDTHCDEMSPHPLSSRPGHVHPGVDATLRRLAAPVANVSTPYFVGTPKVGHTLEGRPGTWSPAAPAVTYAWFDGARSLGTGPTYVVRPAELGHPITVRATATSAGRSATTLAWTKADRVVSGTFWVAGSPTITGTPKVGRTLTARSRSSVPTGVRTYRWFRNGTAISGATRSTYRIVRADKGKRLAVRVHYAQPAYDSTSRTSARTPAIG
ncbi:carboxypeptidase regulatory-like domain-containing protein [Aeromicrobium sp. NPDC092404]|uniref:carboxypeptidase regulatory-like domain-containing protein n=1 Tax=Aeromicrobium sp. NPDC092404 TaxID=3154976 RepID=UPI0034465F33